MRILPAHAVLSNFRTRLQHYLRGDYCRQHTLHGRQTTEHDRVLQRDYYYDGNVLPNMFHGFRRRLIN